MDIIKRHTNVPHDSESFEAAAAPLMEWLKYNANPHSCVIVEQTTAVLYTGEMSAVKHFDKPQS